MANPLDDKAAFEGAVDHIRIDEQDELEMALRYIAVEQKTLGVFVITLKKPPENRLNVDACQELIRAYHGIVCLLCGRCGIVTNQTSNVS